MSETQNTPSPKRWLILVAIVLAFLPVVVDMTVLHIAVPSLTMALGATGTEVLWVIDIYPLIMAGLLVPMGTLADRVGHRKMLMAGLSVFGLASLAAAFSPTAMLLIIARAFLALGASTMMPSILAVIRQTFENDKERAFALGIWSTIASAGAAAGPLVGGFLLEHFWWGSVFLINVPIILLVLPVVYWLVPVKSVTAKGQWRPGQALLLIAGLIMIVYAIKSGVKPGQSAIQTVMSLLLGVGLLYQFARLQLSTPTPMLDLDLFKKPAISVGLIMALVATAAFAGFELLLAQELQYVLGRTPLEAGLFMLPLATASAVAGPFAAMLTSWFGLRTVSAMSMFLSALALLALANIGIMEHPVIRVGLLIVLGFALSTGLLASSVAIMGSTPPDKAGAAGSLESTGYELGAGLGITFFGVLLNMMYRMGFVVPPEIAGQIPVNAANSIGEAMLAAQNIGGVTGDAIAEAAKQAFFSAHGTVLTITASLLCMLGVVVLVMLGKKTRHKLDT